MTQAVGEHSDAGSDAGIGRKVRRALAWSSVNNIVLRLGNFAVGVLLARILAPSQFGVFAVALTVQTVLIAFAELGITSDLIRHGDIERRAPTVTTVATASTALLAGLMALTAAPVATLLGSHQATSTVQVMSLTLVLSGLSVVPNAAIQRDFRQSTQLVLDGTSLVASTILTVVLVYLGFGAMALALSRVLAQAIVCALQYVVTGMRPRFGLNRQVAAGLIRFGLPLAGANLLSWIVMNVDYMMVGALSGAVVLGFYVLAFNISSWPMSALGQAVRAVALPGFARLTDPARRAAGFATAVALSWAAALFAGVALSALASRLVPLVYGPRWMAATQALAGLAFFGALRVVFDIMATYLIAAGATRPVLVVQALWIAVLAPAMAAGIEWYGLAGAGWAHVAVGGAIILPAYLLLVRRHGVRLGPLVWRLTVPVLAAVPAVLAGTYVAHAVHATVPALLAGGTVASVVYLGVLGPWLVRWLRDLRRPAPRVVTEPAAEPELIRGGT